MANASVPLKALLVAEGSGGHLIPALQVAGRLAREGAQVKVWYAQRQPIASLAEALSQQVRNAFVEVNGIPVTPSRHLFGRLRQCGRLWSKAQQCFDTFAPDVVVGFGGWVCAPVMAAAKARRIRCLIHEQNVRMGRTNRWLARWVDGVAVSFRETQTQLPRRRCVITGMPVREAIGRSQRNEAAAHFTLSASRPTVLVLGGSQGSRIINRVMSQAVSGWSPSERQAWQVLHIAGTADADMVRGAYRAAGIAAHVVPFVVTMEHAYALADVAVARAGASTIAELTRCGIPAILIPYPHAAAHQRANAQLVASVDGALCVEEQALTPQRLCADLQRLLGDERLRRMMGQQVKTLDADDAAQRLRNAIVEVAHLR